MKRFFLSTMIAVSSAFAVSQAQALDIEVAPLKPEIRAEVLGIRADVNAAPLVHDALVLTGRSALVVAKTAGIALDASTEMLVLTGNEVTTILNATLGATTNAGGIVLVQTTRLTKLALHTTLAIVADTALFTVHTADVGFDLVSTTLKAARTVSLLVVSDAGHFAFAATNGIFAVVNFALRAVLGVIGVII